MKEENRLLTAAAPSGEVRYGYDPLGRKVSRTVNGATTRYVYDGERMVMETDGGNNPGVRLTHQDFIGGKKEI